MLKILPLLIAVLFAVVLFVPRAVRAAIPGDNVTSMVEMAGGETKSDNFTISAGPVFGPQGGTATIKDGFVTNNANNDRKGARV